MPLQRKQGTIMSDAVSIIIESGGINTRQAVAIAVGKGLKDAGFTDVSVTVDKSGDEGWNEMTGEKSVSFLDTLKQLNPHVFGTPIEVVTEDPFGDTPVGDTVVLKF
jgi:hypothetical protein